LIAYFDTSALVKLVVVEAGSSQALRLWDSADRVASSVLMYPEARAALKRARRDRRLSDQTLRRAIGRMEQLWERIDRVAVLVDLAVRAGELAHVYDLRGYDAVHLAAAEAVAMEDLVFVAADIDLCTAAGDLGLAVAQL
jgi:hypothetical protein